MASEEDPSDWWTDLRDKQLRKLCLDETPVFTLEEEELKKRLNASFAPTSHDEFQQWQQQYCLAPAAEKELRKCNTCSLLATKANILLHCVGCRRVMYCGKQCQIADWKAHKPECNTTTKATTELRKLLKIKKGGAKTRQDMS
eukprot:3701804-Rhodomonas_salina.1